MPPRAHDSLPPSPFLLQTDDIMIVNTIARAADSQTARGVLSECSQRQLYMDNLYGHILFVATQTDNGTRSEILRNLNASASLSQRDAALLRNDRVTKRCVHVSAFSSGHTAPNTAADELHYSHQVTKCPLRASYSIASTIGNHISRCSIWEKAPAAFWRLFGSDLSPGYLFWDAKPFCFLVGTSEIGAAQVFGAKDSPGSPIPVDCCI